MRIEKLPQPSKDVSFELAVLDEMSKYANSFDFHCCPVWNYAQVPQIGPNRIGMLVKETTTYTSVQPFDYECVLAEQDQVSESFLNAPPDGKEFVTPLLPGGETTGRYTLVLGNQYANPKDQDHSMTFLHEPRPDEIAHLSVLKAMQSRVGSQALQRIEKSSVRFQRNVFTILKLIRPFSYTGPKNLPKSPATVAGSDGENAEERREVGAEGEEAKVECGAEEGGGEEKKGGDEKTGDNVEGGTPAAAADAAPAPS